MKFKRAVKQYYDDEAKHIMGEFCTVNNKKEGLYKGFHYTGQLEVLCNYVNNKKEGEYKRFYPNGHLNFIRNYINGKMEGIVINFYENGTLREVDTYKNDVFIKSRNFYCNL